MKQIVFELRGSCGVPDGTLPIEGFPNHFRLPGGQIISIQPVIELESAVDADDHRDLTYAEAIAFGLTPECDQRALDLDDEPG